MDGGGWLARWLVGRWKVGKTGLGPRNRPNTEINEIATDDKHAGTHARTHVCTYARMHVCTNTNTPQRQHHQHQPPHLPTYLPTSLLRALTHSLAGGHAQVGWSTVRVRANKSSFVFVRSHNGILMRTKNKNRGRRE